MAVFLLAMATSCTSTFKVQTETIEPIDFSRIKAFKFYNPTKEAEANFSFAEDDKNTLYSATAKELKNLGVKSSQNADIIVRIQGGVTLDVVNSAGNSRYQNSPYMNYNYYNYYGFGAPLDKSNKHIVLTINFLDPNNNRLLWQGTATKNMGKSNEDFNLHLEEAVGLIFREFQDNSSSK